MGFSEQFNRVWIDSMQIAFIFMINYGNHKAKDIKENFAKIKKIFIWQILQKKNQIVP